MDHQDLRLRIGICILSPIRIYREGLSHVLAQEPAIRVLGNAPAPEDAVALLQDADVDVVLFDVSADPGVAGLRQLARYEDLRVVALGVVEDQESIITCAEAGIAGYATPNSSLAELVQTIQSAARGHFTCPPHIAAGLLQRLAITAPRESPAHQASLTLREREIINLIQRGLSNKEIARRLGIQVATVKNHVHNILHKLGVARRADAVAALQPRHYSLR